MHSSTVEIIRDIKEETMDVMGEGDIEEEEDIEVVEEGIEVAENIEVVEDMMCDACMNNCTCQHMIRI